jgi:hypothetical protein
MSGRSTALSSERTEPVASSRPGRIITADSAAPQTPATARPAASRRALRHERAEIASHAAQMPTKLKVYSAIWKLPGSAMAAPTTPSSTSRSAPGAASKRNRHRSSQGSHAADATMPTCWLCAANQPESPKNIAATRHAASPPSNRRARR